MAYQGYDQNQNQYNQYNQNDQYNQQQQGYDQQQQQQYGQQQQQNYNDANNGNADSGFVCAVCYKAFTADPYDKQIKYKVIGGKNIHFECFQCSNCHQLINGKYATKDDGTFLCVNCIQAVYGQNTQVVAVNKNNPFLCVVCQNDCTKKYIEDTKGQKYCDTCFKCMACGKLLATADGASEQYSELQGQNYCMPCATKKMNQ